MLRPSSPIENLSPNPSRVIGFQPVEDYGLGSKIASRNRPAFTLIEVLVGMFLLATLAVVALQGFRAHKLQLKFAEQRIVAVAELDRMLSIWSSQPAGIPMIGAGAVAPDRPWAWKSSVIEQRIVFGQPLLVVRIEVYDGIAQEAKRLCFVDIMRNN